MTVTVHTLGGRLKAWRELKKLKQPEAASVFGVKPSSYQKYEMDLSAPGAGAMECFVRAGINANWLLTGEGPMLLADLVAPAPQEPTPEPAPAINVDALVQAFCVTVQTAPKGESLALSARKAVQFYLFCLESGLITPEGEGTGNLGEVA